MRSTERLGLGNLFGESSRLITIRLGIRLTLFMRPMGRRVADTGPCSRDSVAHFRVSKGVTPRIVRTHRSRSFVMKRRGGIVLVSDFTAERNGAHQHRRCSRRRGRCASRRASDARRGSPKAHSRLPATPGPRAGVRRQRSAVRVGPGGWVHAIGDAPPARVGDSRSARVRTPPRYSLAARPRLPQRLAAGPSPGWPCADDR